jgi:phosphoribosylformylglycinamidine synthase
MRRIKTAVLAGNGTNCEYETAYACEIAGSDQVDIIHISEFFSGKKSLNDYQFLVLPGGFLDGDDLGAAKANANRFLYAKIKDTERRFSDEIRKFIHDGKLILGICNGFQLMVKLGILPGFERRYFEQTTTLTYNDSGKFEDRWCYLKINKNSKCIYTKNLEFIYLPVRHGEGKFIPKNSQTLERLNQQGQISIQYIDPKSKVPTMEYPYNPNGSVQAIAGICDETGRIFGMMPHPEAYLHYTQHPKWTRLPLPEKGDGYYIFKNAIEFLRENF